MTEENTGSEEEEKTEETESQEDTGETQAQEADTAGQEQAGKSDADTDWEAAAKAARAEAAKARKRAQSAEAKLKTKEDAELNELQKAQKEAQEADDRAKQAEERLKVAEIQAKVERIASKAGAIDPDDVVRFIDQDSLLDDEGNVQDAKVQAAVESLKKAKPHLFKSTTSTSSATNGATAGGHSKADLQKMAKDDPDGFNEVWDKMTEAQQREVMAGS